jgi:hypothetical protein
MTHFHEQSLAAKVAIDEAQRVLDTPAFNRGDTYPIAHAWAERVMAVAAERDAVQHESDALRQALRRIEAIPPQSTGYNGQARYIARAVLARGKVWGPERMRHDPERRA